MWPFKRREERAGNIENPSVSIGSQEVVALFNMGLPSASGVSVNAETALSCAPVWAAVNFLSNAIAQLPLHVYREVDGERDKDTQSPVYPLLHSAPGKTITSFQWRKSMMQSVLLRGRHVTAIVRNNAGRVSSLLPLPMQQVRVSKESDGRIVYQYSSTTGGGVVSYERHEVIDLVWSLGDDGYTHRDPIQRLKNAIGLYLAQEEYASKIFQNGGVPPLQLTGPTQSPAGAKRASEDITREIVNQARDQRNILTMPAGFELKPIGVDPSKMQLESAREKQLGEIARAFGLPKIFLQDLSGATYSNTEQQDLHFVKHTLTAWLKQIEQELNLKLFPQNTDRRFAEFDVSGLLRGDFKSRMDGYAQAVQNGILAPNEARRKENLPPKPNGDDLMMQGATVPIGSQPMNDPPPTDGDQDGQ